VFQIYEDTFLYGGQRMDVKDQFQGQHYTVKLTIDGRAETVLPKLTGYMTGPRSQISKKLGKSGVILIPSGTAGRFAERRHRYCLQREAYQLKKWITHHGAAQGGILHGEIEPGKQMGWYVVLMMQLPRFGGYIDYAEPGYRFLGETNFVCDQIRRERGVDGIYNNGIEFFITTVSGQEVKKLLDSRKA
jgi:hypothetical protein